MLYFIPAWYKQNMWCENEQQWYMRRLKSEFDETIKQITLFHRNVDRPYRILVLGYSPNFRHFLHRQGMYRSKYWSCFDAIAQVRRKKVAVLSYHDIKWPKGLEFVYSPFSIIALQGDVKYAQVEFGEDGNPISIDMFEDGKICRRNYYDDRGFVSSTVIYENGIEQYQDFLMENGIWKIREYKMMVMWLSIRHALTMMWCLMPRAAKQVSRLRCALQRLNMTASRRLSKRYLQAM